jgi:mttA/Hcf106 family protein
MFEGLFQPMHLLVIFGIALLVFGPKKLPELGKVWSRRTRYASRLVVPFMPSDPARTVYPKTSPAARFESRPL